jgi:hypothetical protein
MSNRNNHPIENEELMAYLDGELATDRAIEAAAHLEHCAECQELAADLRKLSQQMMAWEVEGSGDTEIARELALAIEKREKKPQKRITAKSWRWGMLFTPKRLAGAGVFVVLMLLLMAIFIPNLLRSKYSPEEWARISRLKTDDTFSPHVGAGIPAKASKAGSNESALSGTSVAAKLESDSATASFIKNGSVMPPPLPLLNKGSVADTIAAERSRGDDSQSENSPSAPMIARIAGLTITTKDFEKTHASVEEILKRYHGYIGELNVSAPDDAGRTLTATLRIPAAQLDAAMAELKKLGRVENESQGGEEVTQQYVDLEARLANAQHTELRLTDILRQRTGKLQDVLKVELEIDRVRGEIEQMQAEKKELTKRVAFATLNTTIREEYHAKLQATPPSTGSRFRNAAVDGYNTVVEGLIAVGLFMLSSGPSLLIWVAILFFPARWAWRKWKTNLLRTEETRQQ